MITVRFPNGVAVRYPKAEYAVWANSTSDYHALYTKNGGDFVATVPPGCAVEFEEGTLVSKLNDHEVFENAALDPNRLKWLPYGVAKRLKEAFRSFDIRTGRWK